MTSIFLADDHEVVRRGLRSLLNEQPDFSIAGEAADGLKALDLVQRLKPDVLILDLMMPGLNGLDVAQAVKKSSPATKIIILSIHASQSYVLEAVRLGIEGYVLKDCSADDIVTAIRQVLRGRLFLSPALRGRDIGFSRSADAIDAYERLTLRERQILHLVAEGHSSSEIAARLFLSVRTVENHRAHLMEKLSVTNQAELIHYAIRRGIVSPLVR